MAAAAAMAGEIRIIFMTALLNPLVILESVRLLPGAPALWTSAQAKPPLLQIRVDLQPPFHAGFIPL
jgi:hypothetical protein